MCMRFRPLSLSLSLSLCLLSWPGWASPDAKDEAAEECCALNPFLSPKQLLHRSIPADVGAAECLFAFRLPCECPVCVLSVPPGFPRSEPLEP